MKWSCPHREPERMPVEGPNWIFREDVSVWEKHLFRLDLRGAVCRFSIGSQQEVCRGGSDDRPGTELPHKQEVLVWQEALLLCRPPCKYALWLPSVSSQSWGGWSWGGGLCLTCFPSEVCPSQQEGLPDLMKAGAPRCLLDWMQLSWLLTPCLASCFWWLAHNWMGSRSQCSQAQPSRGVWR